MAFESNKLWRRVVNVRVWELLTYTCPNSPLPLTYRLQIFAHHVWTRKARDGSAHRKLLLHRLRDMLIPFCRALFLKISNRFGRKLIIRTSANVCRLSENKNLYLAL
jgi:hypothetical protein